MKQVCFGLLIASLCFAPTLLGQTVGHPKTGQPAPDFREVWDVVRSNLTQLSTAELNQAAVAGFIQQLHPLVSLVTNAPQSEPNPIIPLIPRKSVFAEVFGYVRVARIDSGLGEAFKAALAELRTTNNIKGLVLDLRFAQGQNYAAAAQLADPFFPHQQLLLRWQDQTFKSQTKTNSIALPIITLVNHETAGAAEALAALLHQVPLNLLLGSPTAGEAQTYRELPLSSGQRLRIASGAIQVGAATELIPQGLEPDIRIEVNPDDEKAFYQDPFLVLPKLFAAAAKTNGAPQTSAAAERPRRRLNEAELIRMQREGTDFDPEPTLAKTASAQPVITDPVLARALDLLKGLVLTQKRPLGSPQ